MYRVRVWLAPTVAAVAFALALGVFVAALWHYFRRVNEWSADDLRSRAEMTAAALAEPLRTLDFRAIDATAARLKRDRLRLRICARGSTTPSASLIRPTSYASGASRLRETSKSA